MNTFEIYKTNRLTVPAIEEMLEKEIPVLDNGFVRVVDYMGGDSSIVQAARVSYGRGTKKNSQDRGLIRYLMRHRHTTPFEMCEIKFHIKLPIFVARQWIRHRTANVNEYSARYSILDKEFYIPDREYIEAVIHETQQLKKLKKLEDTGQSSLFDDLVGSPSVNDDLLKATAEQSQSNKQGRGDVLEQDEASEYIKLIRDTSELAYRRYLKLLNEDDSGNTKEPGRKGMARELARMVLPTNIYTQWYWKIDLHNLLHFISLRADGHAQYEIRVYAEVISDIVKKWTPFAWEAFNDYRQNGAHLSSQELSLVKSLIKGEGIELKDSNLSDREWREFVEKFGIS